MADNTLKLVHSNSQYPITKTNINATKKAEVKGTEQVTQPQQEVVEIGAKQTEEVPKRQWLILDDGAEVNWDGPKDIVHKEVNGTKESIKEAITENPAQHVALFLREEDLSGINEISREIKQETGIAIDVLGVSDLNANTYSLKDTADYLIAGDKETLGKGLTRVQDALQQNKDISPRDLARVIVNANTEPNQSLFLPKDLGKEPVQKPEGPLDIVDRSVNDFAEALLHSQDMEGIKKAADSTENYLKEKPWDFGAKVLAENLLKTTTDDKVRTAAQKLIDETELLYPVTPQNKKEDGLSIYLPTTNSKGYKDLAFGSDTSWQKALEDWGT